MPLQDPEHPAHAQVTYAKIYGALLVAILISTFMYGISLSMVLQYFKLEAKRDTSVLKFTILLLITLTTLQTIFTVHELYNTFIISAGNPALMDRITLQLRAINKLTAGNREHMHAPTLSHSLLNYSSLAEFGQSARVFTVDLIPQILLGLLQMGAGLALVSIEATSKTFSGLGSRIDLVRKVMILQGAATAACDILISISLCYVLHSHRSGIKKTDSLINRMIIYAINRGIVTSICALLGAFLYYFTPDTYYFLIPSLANAYLYVISAVSILTLREGLREEINQSFHLSDLYTNTSRSEVTNGRQNVHPDFTEDKNHQTV
ncbi:hypothetical protein M422DRAFT_251624 [Sphaerobolus stellatus SS14]|uniref:DUF6534 domain-containing protein n=1 Tax=Sphaerobolus stellatus (strain SS14) TaxID=990650 RepID=A0A0C9W0M8_SPHS4|nr:hypothetical protein M422DRAFT_251624 [Sphaerobolus stellatus SS14]